MTNTETQNHDFWQSVYAAFPYPLGRVRAEINRIAAKCLKQALGWTGPITLDPSTCDVRAEVIGGKELGDLVCYHGRVNTTGRTTAIVIVRMQGKSVVIEGNNRVNRWVAEGDLTPRQALVIVPREGAPAA